MGCPMKSWEKMRKNILALGLTKGMAGDRDFCGLLCFKRHAKLNGIMVVLIYTLVLCVPLQLSNPNLTGPWELVPCKKKKGTCSVLHKSTWCALQSGWHKEGHPAVEVTPTAWKINGKWRRRRRRRHRLKILYSFYLLYLHFYVCNLYLQSYPHYQFSLSLSLSRNPVLQVIWWLHLFWCHKIEAGSALYNVNG